MRLLNLVRRGARRTARPLGPPSPLPKTADFLVDPALVPGLAPLSLRYWPSYSNPYHALFYGRDAPGYDTRPGDAAAVLAEMEAAPGRRFCFHVHWLNQLMSAGHGAGQETGDARAACEAFLARCREIAARGGRIAWTIHNLYEHESPDRALELELRRALGALADVVVVHGAAAKSAAVEAFGIDPAKIVVVPHGSFIGVYPAETGRAAARAALGLEGAGTVFAQVGHMRPYKGLNELIAAVARLEPEGAALLLAGRVRPPDRAALEAALEAAPATRAVKDFVPDTELQTYLAAADFVALPYRAVLTSGSAILAMSFARPVIAPAQGVLPELIEDGANGFLYDPDAPDGLETALRRALATGLAQRADMQQAAFATAAGLRWSDGRLTFLRALVAQGAGG